MTVNWVILISAVVCVVAGSIIGIIGAINGDEVCILPCWLLCLTALMLAAIAQAH